MKTKTIKIKKDSFVKRDNGSYFFEYKTVKLKCSKCKSKIKIKTPTKIINKCPKCNKINCFSYKYENVIDAIRRWNKESFDKLYKSKSILSWLDLDI